MRSAREQFKLAQLFFQWATVYFERFNSMNLQGNIKVSENKFTVRRQSSMTNESRYQISFADTEKGLQKQCLVKQFKRHYDLLSHSLMVIFFHVGDQDLIMPCGSQELVVPAREIMQERKNHAETGRTMRVLGGEWEVLGKLCSNVSPWDSIFQLEVKIHTHSSFKPHII